MVVGWRFYSRLIVSACKMGGYQNSPVQKVYPSIDQPRILTFAYLPHSHATTLWYLFFALLSSRLERSAAKSSCGDMAWMASYSLLKPMSPSAWSEATCRMKR